MFKDSVKCPCHGFWSYLALYDYICGGFSLCIPHASTEEISATIKYVYEECWLALFVLMKGKLVV